MRLGPRVLPLYVMPELADCLVRPSAGGGPVGSSLKDAARPRRTVGGQGDMAAGWVDSEDVASSVLTLGLVPFVVGDAQPGAP